MPKFISGKRLRPSSTSEEIYPAADSDRGRVIFSAPLRRLQEKAQVFSLEDNASVRSRLTHSQEVAHLGMQILEKIGKTNESTLKKIGIDSQETKISARIFVEVACFLHDIGNPPFGHFGEKVISHWFKNNQKEFISIISGSDIHTQKELTRLYEDLTNFDGNPQGFRIVAKLQWNHDENGLNLTATALASILKYAYPPSEISSSDSAKKKAGYFLTEKHVIEKVWDTLEMSKNCRHPLSYIMEMADDLAYCMSDIEDGLEKGLITGSTILNEIEKDKNSAIYQIYQSRSVRHKFGTAKNQKDHDLMAYLSLKTVVTTKILTNLAGEFVNRIDEIISGKCKPIIEHCQTSNEVLAFFRELAESYLYNSKVVRKNEIIANRVITGILDSYKPLLLAKKERFEAIRNLKNEDDSGNPISIEQSLFLQLAKKYNKVYDLSIDQDDISDNELAREWISRAHLIVDNVSGMTDKYALSQFRLLCAP